MSNTTRKIFTDVLGGTSRDEYIGSKGELFYDQDTGALYVSDGVTAGGTAVSSNGSSSIVPPATRILYVDRGRTDSYTQNGALLTPFKTIQAALNVANNNYTIMIAPGFYTENLTIPDKDSLVIMGTSEVDTTITGSSNSAHTITWTPAANTGAGVYQMEFRNLTVRSLSTTKQAFYLDAVAVDESVGVCCGDKFRIVNCDFQGGGGAGNPTVYVRNAGCLDWVDSRCYGGDLTIVDTACFNMYGGKVGTSSDPDNLNLIYETLNGNTNIIGRKYYAVSRSALLYGNLVVEGHPVIDVDPTVSVYGNVVATSLTSYYDGPSGKDFCPIINVGAQLGRLNSNTAGNITITWPNANTNGTSFCQSDLTGAKIAGTVTLSKASYLPADATRGYAWVNGLARYENQTANSITVNGYTVLDLRGSLYDTAAINVASTGYIDRSVVRLGYTPVYTTPGISYNIAPAFPVGAEYTLTALPNSNMHVYLTEKTDTYFNIIGMANGFADIILTRPH